jgi:hypothetical protein
MEVGATIESPQFAPQVDLLEIFADREVSIFGITGTFRDLAAMCPIDLEDTRVTLEAKNEFVVKAANEAGLEVDQTFEGIFSRITEQRGLERKFTVAASEKTTEVDKENLAEYTRADAAEKSVAPTSNEDVGVGPEVARAVEGTNSKRAAEYQNIAGMLAINELTRVRKIHEDDNQGEPSQKVSSPLKRQMPVKLSNSPLREITRLKVPVETGDSLQADSPRRTENTLSIVRPELRKLNAKTNTNGQYVSFDVLRPLTTHYSDGIRLTPVNNEVFESANSVNEDVPVAEIYSVDRPANEPEYFMEDVMTLSAGENVPNLDQFERDLSKSAWGAELVMNKPTDAYEAFIERLSVFTVRFNGFVDTSKAATSGETSLSDEISYSEICPPIVVRVFERLKKLEDSEKTEVALILQEIAGTFHAMYALKENDAETAHKTTNEEQLEALCAALLGILDISYDDTVLSQFVRVLRSKEFRSAQLLNKCNPEPDLENVGTHEAKFFKKLVSRSLLPISKRLVRTLGNFALSYARTPVTA